MDYATNIDINNDRFVSNSGVMMISTIGKACSQGVTCLDVTPCESPKRLININYNRYHFCRDRDRSPPSAPPIYRSKKEVVSTSAPPLNRNDQISIRDYELRHRLITFEETDDIGF